MGSEDVDGGVDKAHLLVHALAETPDGSIEFREDFMDEDTVPEREWTPQEEIASAIDFYGVPREDPANEDLTKVDGMERYLVTFTDGQRYQFWADDEDHARDQAHDAEPDLVVERVEVEEYDSPAGAGHDVEADRG